MLEQVKQALKQAESSVSFTHSPFLSSHDLSSNQFYGVLLFSPSFCSLRDGKRAYYSSVVLHGDSSWVEGNQASEFN